MIARLQVLTTGATPVAHLAGAETALAAGARWIQLRLKGEDDGSWLHVSQSLRERCAAVGATFIVNDHLWLAEAAGADGVHLGQEDTPIAVARARLGPQAIIGVSTNTAAEIITAANAGADYVGLGPFRGTATKERLRARLGAVGVAEVLRSVAAAAVSIPVVIIGGIEVEDTAALRALGAHGVAVCGAIAHAAQPQNVVRAFLAASEAGSGHDFELRG